jgi:hypothetical protein
VNPIRPRHDGVELVEELDFLAHDAAPFRNISAIASIS